MRAINYEVLAVILIIVCAVILCLEYLWLFILSENQEQSKKRLGIMDEKAEDLIEGVFFAPTDTSKQQELDALRNMCCESFENADIVCNRLSGLCSIKSEVPQHRRESTDQMVEKVNPTEIYSELLKNGNVYQQGYACRMLADFGIREKIPDIIPMLDKKNRELRYNAAMALSRFGEEDSVVRFVLETQNDKKYSFRIVMEMISIYTGDRYLLVKRLLDECEEYMQSIAIKSAARYKIEELEGWYLEGAKSTSMQIKIACIKALSAIAKPEYERELIIASKDSTNWVVRNSAIRGLKNYRGEDAVNAVETALTDKEWHVRQAAAESLVKMEVSPDRIEKTLQGYDRYAADAVRYYLSRMKKSDRGEYGK